MPPTRLRLSSSERGSRAEERIGFGSAGGRVESAAPVRTALTGQGAHRAPAGDFPRREIGLAATGQSVPVDDSPTDIEWNNVVVDTGDVLTGFTSGDAELFVVEPGWYSALVIVTLGGAGWTSGDTGQILVSTFAPTAIGQIAAKLESTYPLVSAGPFDELVGFGARFSQTVPAMWWGLPTYTGGNGFKVTMDIRSTTTGDESFKAYLAISRFAV